MCIERCTHGSEGGCWKSACQVTRQQPTLQAVAVRLHLVDRGLFIGQQGLQATITHPAPQLLPLVEGKVYGFFALTLRARWQHRGR